jgi:hypothetical protein
MRSQLPPIAKAAMRVLAAVYQSVDRFSRVHKYTVGANLRIESMAVARAVTQAWHRRGDRQLPAVREVAVAIDNLKITLQLCDDVKAFRSFAEFEALARIVNDLGRQCGGWLKSLHSMGQNPQGNPPGERAPILSSRAATQVASR